jgi:hypothetical protein
MDVKKSFEMDGRALRIVQRIGNRFEILDEADQSVCEFQLVKTTDGWRGFAHSDPDFRSTVASFETSVRSGEISIE